MWRFLLCAAILCVLGCAPRSSSSQSGLRRSVSAQSPLAKVQSDMSFAQVVAVLGPPTSQSRKLNIQAFNPFVIGNQGQVTVFHYEKLGRVLFAGPDPRGQGTAVIAVEEDPLERGRPK